MVVEIWWWWRSRLPLVLRGLGLAMAVEEGREDESREVGKSGKGRCDKLNHFAPMLPKKILCLLFVKDGHELDIGRVQFGLNG